LLPPVFGSWFWQGPTNESWEVENAVSLLQRGPDTDNAFALHQLVFGATVAWTSVGVILDGQLDDRSVADPAVPQHMADLIAYAADSIGELTKGSWTCVYPLDSTECLTDRSFRLSLANEDDDSQNVPVYDSVTVYFHHHKEGSKQDSTTSLVRQLTSVWKEEMLQISQEVAGEAFFGRDVPGGKREKPISMAWSVAVRQR
jgi:hypothetical protein